MATEEAQASEQGRHRVRSPWDDARATVTGPTRALPTQLAVSRVIVRKLRPHGPRAPTLRSRRVGTMERRHRRPGLKALPPAGARASSLERRASPHRGRALPPASEGLPPAVGTPSLELRRHLHHGPNPFGASGEGIAISRGGIATLG